MRPVPLFEVTVTATYQDAGPRPADDVLLALAEGDDRRVDRSEPAGDWLLSVVYVVRETQVARAKNRALEQFTSEADAAGAGDPWQVRLSVADRGVA